VCHVKLEKLICRISTKQQEHESSGQGINSSADVMSIMDIRVHLTPARVWATIKQPG
jgi:hypothetical protein